MNQSNIDKSVKSVLAVFSDIANENLAWGERDCLRRLAVEGAAIFDVLNFISAKLHRIAESLEIIAAAEKKGGKLADTLTAFYEEGKD